MQEKIIKGKLIYSENNYFLEIDNQQVPLDFNPNFQKYIGDFVTLLFYKESPESSYVLKSITSNLKQVHSGVLRMKGLDFVLISPLGKETAIKNIKFNNIENFINKSVTLTIDKDTESYEDIKLNKKYPFEENYTGILKCENDEIYFIINGHKSNKNQNVINLSSEKDLLQYKEKSGEQATITFQFFDEDHTGKVKNINFKINILNIIHKIKKNFEKVSVLKGVPSYKYFLSFLFLLCATYFFFIDSINPLLFKENPQNTTKPLSDIEQNIKNTINNAISEEKRNCELTTEPPINPKLGVIITLSNLFENTNEIVCYQYDYNIKNIRVKILNDNISDIDTINKIKDKITKIKSKYTKIYIDLSCKKSEQANCSKTIANLYKTLGKDIISGFTLSFMDFDPYFDTIIKEKRLSEKPVLFAKSDLSEETVRKTSQEKLVKRIFYAYFWYLNESKLIIDSKYPNSQIPKSFGIYSWSPEYHNYIFPDIKKLDKDTNQFNYFDIYLSSSDLRASFKSYLDKMPLDINYNILLDKTIQDAKEDVLFYSSLTNPELGNIYIKF